MTTTSAVQASPYTVLYLHEDSMQICSEHIEAVDGLAAMSLLAAQQLDSGCDPLLIAAIPGFHFETSSNIDGISFAGSAAVNCSQFAENHGE